MSETTNETDGECESTEIVDYDGNAEEWIETAKSIAEKYGEPGKPKIREYGVISANEESDKHSDTLVFTILTENGQEEVSIDLPQNRQNADMDNELHRLLQEKRLNYEQIMELETLPIYVENGTYEIVVPPRISDYDGFVETKLKQLNYVLPQLFHCTVLESDNRRRTTYETRLKLKPSIRFAINSIGLTVAAILGLVLFSIPTLSPTIQPNNITILGFVSMTSIAFVASTLALASVRNILNMIRNSILN